MPVFHRFNLSLRLDDQVGFVIPKQSGGFVMGLRRTVSEFQWGSNQYKVLAGSTKGKRPDSMMPNVTHLEDFGVVCIVLL